VCGDVLIWILQQTRPKSVVVVAAAAAAAAEKVIPKDPTLV
jgi:hypothetical protein